MSGVYAKKILIVTNNQTISSPIVTALTHFGYECFLSHDSKVVISGLPQLRPDLIIIDIAMDDVDGFEIFQKIRDIPDPELSNTPVAILSAAGDISEISRAIKLNIKDYFVKKNFDIQAVSQKIRKLLGDDQVANESPAKRLEESELTAKLLIVEDDKFLRDLASQKLSREHLQVFTAVDGEQGVAVAETNIPDIILLDILLPGIDGFEVLRRLRLNPALQKTHIAMLSNFGQKEDIERAFAAGADNFLVKANYTLDEIVQEVKKIMATPRIVSSN